MFSLSNLLPYSIPILFLHSIPTGGSALAFSIPSSDSQLYQFPEINANVLKTYTLHQNSHDKEKRCIGRCLEVIPPSIDPNAEEDEVEQFYLTTRRSFIFPGNERKGSERKDNTRQDKRLDIRQTSFGCGRLGATIWPSGIALSSIISGEFRPLIEGKRVLELGSGCGLPSLVAKEICNARGILATDYWEEEVLKEVSNGGKVFSLDTSDRLVPKPLFGANLSFNLGSQQEVQRLDWHDEFNIFQVANDFSPEVIIGSDIIYYPMDMEPLLQTLNVMLKSTVDEVILISPLPPTSEREALPLFRSRLESGEFEGCEVRMDELKMVCEEANEEEVMEEEVYNMLRICISKR